MSSYGPGIPTSYCSLALHLLLAMLAGCLGGLLGIGGGMIMAPMLMELHVHPQVRRTPGAPVPCWLGG